MVIKFNELRIELGDCAANDCLHIAASVPTIKDYFNDIYIDGFYIIKASDYVVDKDPESYTNRGHIVVEGNVKSVDFFTSPSSISLDFDIRKDPLIVFAYTKGTPHEDTPCGLDMTYTKGVIYNECLISNLLINDLAKIDIHSRDCITDRSAINHYLLYKHMKLSFCMNNFTDGLADYNKLVGIKPKTFNTCGCGR